MERSIRRHRSSRLLLHRTELLALDLRFRHRRMDLLLRHQRRDTTAHSQRRFRRQLMGYRYPATILQDRVNLHFTGCDLVRDKVQRHE
jgi:hypothetical protein